MKAGTRATTRRLPVGKAAATLPELAELLLTGLSAPGVAACLCDDEDDIRYASDSFRRTFFPQFDGFPVNFAAALEAAIVAGVGIKIGGKPPRDFARMVDERRRRQVGALSFATDIVDGSWWWVTDVKLPNGWMMCVAQNISALKHEEFRLRDAHAVAVEQAQTDHLTGVASRREGLKVAESLFGIARHTGAPFAIALFDLDHFKPINDRFGHEAGDRALVHFTEYVVAALAPTTRFSRLGGDEFLLVMPNTTAAALKARLARVLAGLPLVTLATGHLVRLTVSIGVAEMADSATLPALLGRADAALYRAKREGRGGIACTP